MSGEAWVGGLVGLTASSGVAIDRSIATADVTGHTGVAGLVGLNHGTTRDSYASGAVRGINSFIGGLVGDQVTGAVVNSRADGAVSGEALTPAISTVASIVGGLVGRNESGARITGSVATGAVTGTASNTNSDQFGGLVGSNKGSISGSVATGAVSAGQFVGGLVGQQGIATASVTESWASGDVRAVTDASVEASGRLAGGLIGSNFGTVGASFATGNVTGVRLGRGLDRAEHRHGYRNLRHGERDGFGHAALPAHVVYQGCRWPHWACRKNWLSQRCPGQLRDGQGERKLRLQSWRPCGLRAHHLHLHEQLLGQPDFRAAGRRGGRRR